ncbi:hypothetical protein Gotur_013269 [Gossypium turneri]
MEGKKSILRNEREKESYEKKQKSMEGKGKLPLEGKHGRIDGMEA